MRARYSNPVDPTARLAQQIKALQQQIAELQRAAARPLPSKQVVFFSPASNTDATTSAAWVDWLTLGNVVVPDWASSALCTITLNGVNDITAANNTYFLRPKIGSVTGTHSPPVRGIGVGARFSATIVDEVDGLSAGTQSLRVQAWRVGGSGQFRADASAVVTAVVEFYP